MSIQKRGEGRDARYLVRWRDESGKQKSKSFSRKRDAAAFDAERQAAALRGEGIGVAGVGSRGQLPVSHFVAEWKDSTTVTRTRAIRNSLLTNLGSLAEVPIAKLDRAQIQSWVNLLAEGRPWKNDTALSPVTIKGHLTGLRSVLKLAVEDEVIDRDPSIRVTIPKVAQSIRPKDIPTSGEIEQMVKAAELFGNSLPLMIRVGAATGMRVSEVCALTPANIDYDNGFIQVEEQLDGLGSRTSTKTLRSQRRIPVGPGVLDALKPLTEQASVRDTIFVRDSPRARSRRQSEWTNQSVSKAFLLLRDKGLIGEFTFHSLRHYYASVMLSRGVNVKAVQEAMGHSSPQTTLTIYAHVLPRSLGEMRDASDGIMRDI